MEGWGHVVMVIWGFMLSSLGLEEVGLMLNFRGIMGMAGVMKV